MKSISTLVTDIYDLISNPKGFSERNVIEFGKALAKRLAVRLSERRGASTLRASNLGKPCGRQLWYEIHCSSEREVLPPAARLKYLFGDILEELLLFLAREAGHTVSSEQAEIEINGVKGHIDGIIDGHLVDCKSASSFAFEKFRSHTLPDDDPFGYIDQLGAYLAGSKAREELKEKDVASFLVIDKSLGHITLDTYPATGKDYVALVAEKRKMLESKTPPDRPYEPKPFQKGGNEKLPVACSYCSFKNKCWPGLRTFIYSNGPVFLTKVVKTPAVTEVDKDGKLLERKEEF